MDLKQLTVATLLINKHFRLDNPIEVKQALKANQYYDWLLDELSTIISYLLDNDMHQLMQVMYRIDVSEHRFKQIITSMAVGDVAEQLAVEVIRRELQKAATRMSYANR